MVAAGAASHQVRLPVDGDPPVSTENVRPRLPAAATKWSPPGRMLAARDIRERGVGRDPAGARAAGHTRHRSAGRTVRPEAFGEIVGHGPRTRTPSLPRQVEDRRNHPAVRGVGEGRSIDDFDPVAWLVARNPASGALRLIQFFANRKTDELFRNGSRRSFAARVIGVVPRAINEIVHAKRSITPAMSIRLGAFFGQSGECRHGIQVECDFQSCPTRHEPEGRA